MMREVGDKDLVVDFCLKLGAYLRRNFSQTICAWKTDFIACKTKEIKSTKNRLDEFNKIILDLNIDIRIDELTKNTKP